MDHLMPNVLIIFVGILKLKTFFQGRRFLSHPLSHTLSSRLPLSLSLRLGCKKMEVSGNRLGRLLLLASLMC